MRPPDILDADPPQDEQHTVAAADFRLQSTQTHADRSRYRKPIYRRSPMTMIPQRSAYPPASTTICAPVANAPIARAGCLVYIGDCNVAFGSKFVISGHMASAL